MVSVILPNYNHAPYLKKRIDSILSQTYTNFELIILDDCSTDNSRQIIDEYKSNPYIKQIIYNSVNSGSPFIQWQKGFDLANGEYIWIAESDDYADSKFLETLLPAFKEDSSIGVVYSDSNVVDSENVIHPGFYKKHRNTTFKTAKWNTEYRKTGLDEIQENLFFECTINNTSSMVFRKDLLQNVNFDQLRGFKYCGDWFFFISLLNHCDIVYKKEALNYFKYGTDNFKKGTKSVLNYFKERYMVRYYFWSSLKSSFTKKKRVSFYKQIGLEMQIQINEVLKGKSSFLETLKSFYFLFRINSGLFSKHLCYTCRSYIWKN